MTREESIKIKGIAILLMIFYHLFNRIELIQDCYSLYEIGGLPLAHFLTHACNPVGFFLILSGYGMYKIFEKGNDPNRYCRILKLMIHYWFIMSTFLLLGCFISPDKYPGSVLDIFAHISGYHTTYNGEMWFLLPFIIVSLISPWYFRLIRNLNSWIIIMMTFCGYLFVAKFGWPYEHIRWIYVPLCVVMFLFNFSLGALAARERMFERLKKISNRHKCAKLIVGCGIAIVFIVKCFSSYFFGYEFIMLSLLVLFPVSPIIHRLLVILGSHSMNMWMIHSWFCYHLFRDYTYSLHYPVFIFITLVIVSFLVSKMVNRLVMPIENMILSRFQRISL